MKAKGLSKRAMALANDDRIRPDRALIRRDLRAISGAKRELFCGNLYVNRKCTGAMVNGHPFG